MKSYLSGLHPYWLWGLMALPAMGFIYQAMTPEETRIFQNLLHPTGEFAARFLIITLLATPLMYLFKGWRGPRWLRRNRRYFGVAAFGYALLHLVFYVLHTATLNRMLADLTELHIWAGWLAFAIFIPLAATSSDYAVRRMGPRWKALQKWTYAAAVLILLHWALIDEGEGLVPALVHFTPLAALTLYRLWYMYLRPRPARA